MIELSHVYAGYGKKLVLQNINASFEKGKVTCIIGPNGSGKSTLLKTVLNVLPIMNGQMKVDEDSITELQSVEIARKIAYLAQGKSVPDMTVEQLVLHGRFPYLSYPRRYRKLDKEIAAQAMQQMDIVEYADQRLNELSGGIRQNVYIAMALAQSTDYILLDEPTTYLDIARQLQLMEMIAELAKGGKGIVAVLHDLPLAIESADAIVVMKEGRIAMNGCTAEVYASGIIDEVFGVHLHRTEDGHYLIRKRSFD